MSSVAKMVVWVSPALGGSVQEEAFRGNLVSLLSVTWLVPALYLGRWGPWVLAYV